MKQLFFMQLLLAQFYVGAQREILIRKLEASTTFSENCIYMIGRGTASKSHLIAGKFNYSDTNITHVGIGVFHNNTLEIFNVTDNSRTGNSLVIDSLLSFAASPDVYYLSLWQCKTAGREPRNVDSLVNLYRKKRILFDSNIFLSFDDTLYCSEFCAMLLSGIAPHRFQFAPRRMVLNNPLYESVLQRKVLTYYPVDFFEQGGAFKKIAELRFERIY